jgi:ubiquinone/menaquinone biosynthesis C-methylase UbiE
MDEDPLRRRLVKLAALRFGDCALNLDCAIASLTIALADSAEGVVVAATRDAVCPTQGEHSGEQAQRPNVLLFRAAPVLPFANRQFNIVVATFQPAHRNDRSTVSTLQQVWRVMLPRGKFVAGYWEGRSNGASDDASTSRYQVFRNLICDAGFEWLRDDGRLTTSSGIVHCLHARAPRRK